MRQAYTGMPVAGSVLRDLRFAALFHAPFVCLCARACVTFHPPKVSLLHQRRDGERKMVCIHRILARRVLPS